MAEADLLEHPAVRPWAALRPARVEPGRIVTLIRQGKKSRSRAAGPVGCRRSVADAYLRALAADPDRVKQLCGWEWLTAALDALPAA